MTTQRVVDAEVGEAIIMAMQAESLEVLEKADVSPSQARAIVRAIEIEITGARDVLATKHDVVLLRSDLRQETTVLGGEMATLAAGLRGELAQVRSEMGELRTVLRGEMATLAAGLRGELAQVRSEMGELRTELRGEMATLAAGLRGEMAQQRGELKAEIHAGARHNLRHLYTALLGQMVVLLGILYFFVLHVIH